jgi:cathepsin F
MSINIKFLITLALILYVVKSEEQKINSNSLNFSDDELFRKFQRFMDNFKKNYDSIEEYTKRYEIFKINYIKIKNETLEKSDDDEEGMRMGTSPFSDLTEEEFKKNFLSNVNTTNLPTDMEIFKYEEITDLKNSTSTDSFLQGRNLQSIPMSWDWRQSNVVTSVKQQGRCGSCWAFSTIANIEGQYAKKYKSLESFSEQQLIDCDHSNNGCNGGIMDAAFNYIKRAGGLMKRSSYPFTGYRGVCKLRLNQVGVRVKSYISAGTNNEESIKAFLYKTGPLSITVNAKTWQFYKGGVYNVSYSKCPYKPDHGVTLVGYGVTAAGIKYWIIKNSWGPQWGESGYMRIRRGTGLCGVNQYVYSAIIA